MKKTLITLLFFLIIAGHSFACTNLIVTKGASKDGSAFLVYLNDGEWHPHLNITPAADHDISDSLVYHSLSGKEFKIHQVAHTYRETGILMNEYQLALGETTFTGRVELWDKNLPLKYWDLMKLTLQRAKTAREAIQVMTSLVEQYGYGSEGESFSIADPNEAWLLEMIGTGGEGGAVWVAMRIPDGMVTAHANHSRIGTFPLDDPDNCLYSKNVIKLAVKKGYYELQSGKPFRFNDVYDPPSPSHLKYTETRVWSLFRRIAPSQNFSSDYHRGEPNAKPYPLFIKPDNKLGLRDVFSLIRDHYEGTDFDMTKGLAAGPFGNPNRPRPMEWEMNDKKYSWERPISTPQTAYSYVAQLRGNMPNDFALAWFSFDDTYTNCYFPFYIASGEIPPSYKTGNIRHFDRASMWWAFNFVSNFANIRYQPMVKDIRKVQQNLEAKFIKQQDSVERAALTASREERIKKLSAFSLASGNEVHKQWVELGNFLVMKYNDGYVKDSVGRIKAKGYPEEWLNTVTKQEGVRYIINKRE